MLEIQHQTRCFRVSWYAVLEIDPYLLILTTNCNERDATGRDMSSPKSLTYFTPSADIDGWKVEPLKSGCRES